MKKKKTHTQMNARLYTDNSPPSIQRKRRIIRIGVNASGMICGGQQTVVVGFWQPGQALPATGDPWSIIGDGWAYHHTPTQKFTACLIGGGHVSLALSRLLDRMAHRQFGQLHVGDTAAHHTLALALPSAENMDGATFINPGNQRGNL